MIDWTSLTPVVKRAAAKARSTFPDHHELSDVEQTLWVWVMENKSTVLGILADAKWTDTALADLMVKAARSHLKKEDAAAYGYSEEDQYEFSADLIKRILQVVFIHEDWQSFASAAGDGMPRAKSEPATSGNNLASYADVSRAIDMLPDELYDVLVWRYKYHETFERIGQHVGVGQQAAGRRHDRAVSAIQQTLGKKDLNEFRRGHGGRTETRTNAAANARTERDYEG